MYYYEKYTNTFFKSPNGNICEIANYYYLLIILKTFSTHVRQYLPKQTSFDFLWLPIYTARDIALFSKTSTMCGNKHNYFKFFKITRSFCCCDFLLSVGTRHKMTLAHCAVLPCTVAQWSVALYAPVYIPANNVSLLQFYSSAQCLPSFQPQRLIELLILPLRI